MQPLPWIFSHATRLDFTWILIILVWLLPSLLHLKWFSNLRDSFPLMQCRSIHANREILLVRPHCGAREPLYDLYLDQFLVTQRLWQLFSNSYSIARLFSDYSKILSVTIMLKFYASQALPHNGNWQFTYKVTETHTVYLNSNLNNPHCPSTF